jgi:hypothetical protein
MRLLYPTSRRWTDRNPGRLELKHNGDMLFKFKSKASGDLIMLELHGSQVLRTIGKEPTPKGILLCAEMPQALQALQAAIAEIAEQQARGREHQAKGEADESSDRVNFHQRALPFMDLLRRCMAHPCDLVWGV